MPPATAPLTGTTTSRSSGGSGESDSSPGNISGQDSASTAPPDDGESSMVPRRDEAAAAGRARGSAPCLREGEEDSAAAGARTRAAAGVDAAHLLPRRPLPEARALQPTCSRRAGSRPISSRAKPLGKPAGKRGLGRPEARGPHPLFRQHSATPSPWVGWQRAAGARPPAAWRDALPLSPGRGRRWPALPATLRPLPLALSRRGHGGGALETVPPSGVALQVQPRLFPEPRTAAAGCAPGNPALVPRCRRAGQGCGRHYRAALCAELKQPLAIEEVAPRPVRPHEVRVDVHFCGVNFADILVCRGQYQERPHLPFIPGMEFSGTVLETGTDVSTVKKGDRVIGTSGFNTMAEECIVDQKILWQIPDKVSLREAATLPISYGTAILALEHRARTQPGNLVFFMQVIAVAGSDEKCKLAMQRGAQSSVNYSQGSLKEAVRKLVGTGGVHVAIDMVGGDVFLEALRSLAWEGRIVVVGFAGGNIASMPTNLLLLKNISAMGLYYGQYRDQNFPVFSKNLSSALQYCQEGRIQPYVGKVFKLEEVLCGFNSGRKILCSLGMNTIPSCHITFMNYLLWVELCPLKRYIDILALGSVLFYADLLNMVVRSCFQPLELHTKSFRQETAAEAERFRAADVASQFPVSASCE
ncbi:PREDICTED: synaptic vesicle membrane protein VAT-1 homolog [Galeopterus variegatus]|uniref:Synaptic vesicle membrane protein VAT-1 homolog n=1 Tax=Galeopterus variegatus TaxID=482537 RepID=A0ABM0QNV0_GALVR|nr:PREDICTED: synaptic vesicle membrane protein VAT-1 homolog [Galeopterus variegatus]